MNSVDRFLKTKEVAEWLRVSPRTVLQYVYDGKLPATRVSAKVLRYKASDIELFLKNHGH